MPVVIPKSAHPTVQCPLCYSVGWASGGSAVGQQFEKWKYLAENENVVDNREKTLNSYSTNKNVSRFKFVVIFTVHALFTIFRGKMKKILQCKLLNDAPPSYGNLIDIIINKGIVSRNYHKIFHRWKKKVKNSSPLLFRVT
jgi:hypothetical protein